MPRRPLRRSGPWVGAAAPPLLATPARARRRPLDRRDAFAPGVGTFFLQMALAVATGFGPAATSYLRRFGREEGPAEPVPVILPLNAFHLFPWRVSLLTLGLPG